MSGYITLEVVGVPVPQGSMRPIISRSTGKAFVKQDEGLLRYRADIRAVALAADLTPLTWAVTMNLSFILPRPAYHFYPVNTKRSEPEVKPSAPVFPFGPPDVDKLCRAVMDALTGIVYLDDAQVISLHATKAYSDAPTFGGRTLITLTGGDGP